MQVSKVYSTLGGDFAIKKLQHVFSSLFIGCTSFDLTDCIRVGRLLFLVIVAFAASCIYKFQHLWLAVVVFHVSQPLGATSELNTVHDV